MVVDFERPIGDAFGSALLAHLHGDDGSHVLEREDGFVETMTAESYFAGPGAWPGIERIALGLVVGRVLDAGAGAGRASLAIQDQGGEVLAIDTSVGAVHVCRERGVRSVVAASISDPGDALVPGSFDTILLLGNNLGILGSEAHARTMFGAMRRLLADGGVVVGVGVDPYRTDSADHLQYHDRNRRAGRLPGQIRMRVRHRRVVGPWFDWLFVSLDELGGLARASGWTITEATEPDPSYAVVLEPATT